MEEQALELEHVLRRTKLELANCKDELRRSEIKISQLDDAATTAQSKIYTLESVKEYSLELQSRLAFSEQQAEDRRREASLLRQDMTGLRRQIDEGLQREEAANTRQSEASKQLRAMEDQVRQMQEEKEQALTALQSERGRVKQLEEMVSNRGVLLEKSEAEKNHLRNDVSISDQALDNARRECAEAGQTIEELRQRISDLDRADRRELTARAEVETLKTDNSRLLKLLRSTSEYCEFQMLWEDSNGVAYTPPYKETHTHAQTSGSANPGVLSGDSELGGGSPVLESATDRLGRQRERFERAFGELSFSEAQLMDGGGNPTAREKYIEWADLDVIGAKYGMNMDPIEPEEEAEAWVPMEAMRVAKDFHSVYTPDVPIGTIHAFLRNMNRIWRLREAQHVERLRTRFKEQVDEYARQSNQDKSYESVMADWSIRRLKKEVRDARGKLLKGHSKKDANTNTGPTVVVPESSTRSLRSLAVMHGMAEDALLKASLSAAQRMSATVNYHHQSSTRSGGSGEQEKKRKGDSRGSEEGNRSRTGPADTTRGGGGERKWWEDDVNTQQPLPVGGLTGVGSQPFMAGAAWFGRTAVHLTETLGSDLHTLAGESVDRIKDLDSQSSFHTTAERAMLLEQTHKRFLAELERRVNRRRQQVKKLYEDVLDHQPDDSRGFELLDARMPKTP